MSPRPLPAHLGTEFSVDQAREAGVGHSRLRTGDLEIPFRGTRRLRARPAAHGSGRGTEFVSAHAEELALIRTLNTRLSDRQFFSHRSAALLWGAPMPHSESVTLHVGTVSPSRAVRVRNVVGHSFVPGRVEVRTTGPCALLAPACTFASLAGTLSLPELVAVGDYLVRRYRPGVGRARVGRLPLTTLDELSETVARGRWRGSRTLREALALVREDAWSPRESFVRVTLVRAGLPEPELNIDLWDRRGRFLGCVDMVYQQWRVIIEYQGEQHREHYASDVERYERFRAEGWGVIQVTRLLARREAELVARVESALRRAGWPGP